MFGYPQANSLQDLTYALSQIGHSTHSPKCYPEQAFERIGHCLKQTAQGGLILRLISFTDTLFIAVDFLTLTLLVHRVLNTHLMLLASRAGVDSMLKPWDALFNGSVNFKLILPNAV